MIFPLEIYHLRIKNFYLISSYFLLDLFFNFKLNQSVYIDFSIERKVLYNNKKLFFSIVI